MRDPMGMPESLSAAIRESVQRLYQNVTGATGCVVATVDGRLIHHVSDQDSDPARIAAMVGSMVALGETVAKEVQISRSQYVVVHAQQGMLLMLRVPSKKQLLVVATLAKASSNLGIVLHETRRCTQAIAVTLNEWLDSVRP